jgi:hypothetical protein
MFGFQTVANFAEGAPILRRRRYGIIEAVDGRLSRIVLRPFPTIVSLPEIWISGGLRHRFGTGDRCLLYYNQPLRFSDFLVLKYVVSNRAGSLASFRRVLETLDAIARLKQSHALLCDLANGRISAEMITRLGWEPHCPSRWHRHFIKRF